MRNPRVFIEQTLKLDQQFLLDKKNSHYLLDVLRLKKETNLRLFNGDGFNYNATLIDVIKKRAQIKIISIDPKEVPARLAIHLGIGLSKSDRMDYAIQKAVELGVNEISLLQTEYTSVKVTQDRLKKKMLHWQGIIHSACEQSGRCYLPTLHFPQTLNDWLTICSTQADIKIILNPLSQISMKEITTKEKIILLIGPEGGFSQQEVSQAEKQGFQSARLGTHILRTETAPVAAISVAQILWGDFR